MDEWYYPDTDEYPEHATRQMRWYNAEKRELKEFNEAYETGRLLKAIAFLAKYTRFLSIQQHKIDTENARLAKKATIEEAERIRLMRLNQAKPVVSRPAKKAKFNIHLVARARYSFREWNRKILPLVHECKLLVIRTPKYTKYLYSYTSNGRKYQRRVVSLLDGDMVYACVVNRRVWRFQHSTIAPNDDDKHVRIRSPRRYNPAVHEIYPWHKDYAKDLRLR